ncbi:MAG: hypothetical protein ACLT3H_11485 [Roseburia sp.]
MGVIEIKLHGCVAPGRFVALCLIFLSLLQQREAVWANLPLLPTPPHLTILPKETGNAVAEKVVSYYTLSD